MQFVAKKKISESRLHFQVRVIRGKKQRSISWLKSSSKSSPTPSLRQAQDRHRRRHGSPPHPRPRLPFDKLRAGLEAVYQAALAHELTLRGIRFEQFKKLPVYYKGILVGEYEADFVIEGKIILEIKAVSKLHPRHEAQAHHYLAATGLHLAILLNFGAESLRQKRIVR